MTWIDLKSPALQNYLYAWCDLRGSRKVPLVTEFDKFAAALPQEFTAVVEVSTQRDCSFVKVGAVVGELYKGCRAGLPAAKISPLPERLNTLRLFSEVLTSRQPTARRTVYNSASASNFFEQLIVPFIDQSFNVRKLVITVDGYALAREENR